MSATGFSLIRAWMSALAFDRAGCQPADDPALEDRHEDDIGMVMTTAAAAMGPVGVVNCELPLKKASAAGAVRALIVEVSEIANRNSFQQNMNTKMALVTMPGAASGAMTFVKPCHGVAPSTFAAFSRCHGICWKKAARM